MFDDLDNNRLGLYYRGFQRSEDRGLIYNHTMYPQNDANGKLSPISSEVLDHRGSTAVQARLTVVLTVEVICILIVLV